MSSDPQTLQAFLLALPQLNAPLSTDLQQAVHMVGQDLANRQPWVTEEIIQLVEQNPCLAEVFQETYEHFKTEKPTLRRTGEGALLVNSSAKPLADLETVAVPVLTAEDPIAASRSLVRAVFFHWQRYASEKRGNLHQALDRFGSSLALLTKVAQQIETQERSVLRALETHPLTVEDLTFILNMTLDQVQTNIASLWRLAEIDLTTNSLWHRLLPLAPSSRDTSHVDPDAHFTLTMRGYFRLHPMITTRYRGMP